MQALQNGALDKSATEDQQQPSVAGEASGETPTAAEVKAATVSPIQIDPTTKTMVAKDNVELMRVISIYMKGNSFPKSIDTPAKCITAWNLAVSLCPEAPQRAISRMMYINDVLGIWGELPKSLAERTKELTNFELFVVDKEYNKICLENKNLHVDPYAAICRIKRGKRTMNEYYFTVDEAEKAGLLNKRGPWQQYAKAMLCWRAQGQGLKFEFADALMGAEIIEYRFNENPEFKDVTPKTDTAAILNGGLEAKCTTSAPNKIN